MKGNETRFPKSSFSAKIHPINMKLFNALFVIIGCRNKLIVNWSLSTLRKAGICADHFNENSFLYSDRTKLKSNAIPKPYKEPDVIITTNQIWDHTYSKELAQKGKEKDKDRNERTEENDTADINLEANSNSESRNFKCLKKIASKSHKVVKILDSKPQWRSSNPTFIKTYSRKLSFKEPDDSMEWTAIEPVCTEDNVGELGASEALKKTVNAVKTAASDELIQEHESREMNELRMMNMELRRQNKILRIENFKLQLRLATATQSKGER